MDEVGEHEEMIDFHGEIIRETEEADPGTIVREVDMDPEIMKEETIKQSKEKGKVPLILVSCTAGSARNMGTTT